MTSKAWLRLLVSFGISAVMVILLVRSVDPKALGDALGAMDWRLLLPATLLYFVGAWLRSIRWGLLLPEYDVPTFTLFRALIVGFTVNNLLPIRMGEVARTYLLARWCAVPVGASIASLVLERILDGLSLAAMLLLALLFVPAPAYLIVIGILIGGGFLAGAAVLALAAWRSNAVVALVGWLTRPLPERPREVLRTWTAGFARALTLVRGRGRLVRLVVLSLLAWSFELSLFLVLMPAMHIDPHPAVAFLVGAAANFATLVPSSPGYVGTFDAALVKVLGDVAGVAPAAATSYALVVHATLFLPVVVLGTLVLWRSNLTFGQITHKPQRAETAASGSDLQPAA